MSADRTSLQTVETFVLAEGWSLAVEAALVRKLGLSERRIRALKDQVVERWVASASEPIERQRAEFLARVRRFQSLAVRERAFGPLASLISVEARVRGIEAVQQVNLAVRAVQEPMDSRTVEVRRLDLARRLRLLPDEAPVLTLPAPSNGNGSGNGKGNGHAASGTPRRTG